jgi:hypothetical protein
LLWPTHCVLEKGKIIKNIKDTTQNGNKIIKKKKEKYVPELSSRWILLGRISVAYGRVRFSFYFVFSQLINVRVGNKKPG